MRPELLVLLFCALLLRTFIPSGFMIGTGPAGAMALQLCPDAGAIPMHHPGKGQPHGSGHRESPCPFGALASPAVPPAPLLLAAPQVAPSVPILARDLPGVMPALAAPPPPSTGPPASA